MTNHLLAIAMASELPRSLYIFQLLPASNSYSSMILSGESPLRPSRRQVVNMLLWSVRISRPPIRKAICCAGGIVCCNTGLRGPAGRVHIFCTWTARRVRHSRSKAGISERGMTVPGIGRPLKRTSKRNWSYHIVRRYVMTSSRFDVWRMK